MLTVACVKWGDKYGGEYVHRLRRGVERHLARPHRFVCFTENPVDDVECRELPSELPTWWSKVGLFRPGVLDGEVLYLDLDVVLTGSIDPLPMLLEEADGLWARDDFSYSLRTPRHDLDVAFRKFLGGAGTVNSSVMLWRGDCCRSIWDEFTPAVMQEVHGDQNYISRLLWPRGQIHFIPDDYVGSFKYGRLRNEAVRPVTVFHGNPKPPDLPDSEPLKRAWMR